MRIENIRQNDPKVVDLLLTRPISNLQEVISACSRNTQLRNIKLGRQFVAGTSADDLTTLFHTVGALPALRRLQVAAKELPVSVLTILLSYGKLEELDISGVKLQATNTSEWQELCVSFFCHPTLRNVSFKDVTRGEECKSTDKLLCALGTIPYLQSIKLQWHASNPAEVSLYALALLCRAGAVRHICLQHCSLSPSHCRLLAQRFGFLESLSLQHCSVDNEGALMLSQALPVGSISNSCAHQRRLISKKLSSAASVNLKELDLSWNMDLTDSGCEALAEALPLCQLRTLRLWGCKRMSNKGLGALAAAVPKTPTLQTLETPLILGEPRNQIYQSLQQNQMRRNSQAALAA